MPAATTAVLAAMLMIRFNQLLLINVEMRAKCRMRQQKYTEIYNVHNVQLCLYNHVCELHLCFGNKNNKVSLEFGHHPNLAEFQI